MNDEFYISLAINEAWKYQLLTYPNPPVGALILDINGKILALEAHKIASDNHAEVEAIISAYKNITDDKKIDNINNKIDLHEYLYKNHDNIFKNSTIYTTLEPCNHYGKTPPCAKLIAKLGFKKVVSAVPENSLKAKGAKKLFFDSNIKFISNILADEGQKLLSLYNKWIQNDNFTLFKCALTLNGVYEGNISEKEFLIYSHKIRNVANTLIIGGNSIRLDRPLLDSRLVDGRAPNIFIYSHNKEFDKSIPLFSVSNRKVTISDKLSDLEGNGLFVIEGTNNLLNTLHDRIDYILLAVNPKFSNGKTLNINDENMKLENFNSIGNDILYWYKYK